MQSLITSPMTDAPVIQQAATVVAEAVRGTLVAALHAAEVCRCRRCRAQAVQTVTWAVAMIAAEPVTVEP